MNEKHLISNNILGSYISNIWLEYISEKDYHSIISKINSLEINKEEKEQGVNEKDDLDKEMIENSVKNLLFTFKIVLEDEFKKNYLSEKKTKKEKAQIKRILLKDLKIRKSKEFNIIKQLNNIKHKELKKNSYISYLANWAIENKILKKPFLNLPFLKYKIIKTDEEIKKILDEKIKFIEEKRKNI